MDAALLLLIAAWSRGGAARHDRGIDGAPERASGAPLRRRPHARSAWLRALEEVALVDRRMKPSPIRKPW